MVSTTTIKIIQQQQQQHPSRNITGNQVAPQAHQLHKPKLNYRQKSTIR